MRSDTATCTLLEGKTAHARYHPIRHEFTYPVLYASVPVSDDDPPDHIHQLTLGGALSVRQRDYLPAETTVLTGRNLHCRLRNLLQINPTYASLILPQSRVILLTMPRWLGYAFNPVSVFYVYSASNEWQLAVLLVNNTFEETYPYILPLNRAKPSQRAGYSHQWSIERRFHVSPFNDRLGSYNVHLNDPLQSGSRYNFLVIHYWSDDDAGSGGGQGDEVKKLKADLTVRPVDGNIAAVIMRYPLTLFLTFPRISYQAFQLAYRKYLRVYPRPMLLKSGTIQQTPVDYYNRWCRDKLVQWLSGVAKHTGNCFVIDYRPARVHRPIVINGDRDDSNDIADKPTTFYLTVVSDEVWSWFHMTPTIRVAMEFLVAMSLMELHSATAYRTVTDSANIISAICDQAEALPPGKRSAAFHSAILCTARRLVFRTSANVANHGNIIDAECGFLETVYGLMLLTVSLTVSLIMDLVTRWHAGYEPSPWSQWSRYKSMIPNKKRL